jgi:hypothetical protein
LRTMMQPFAPALPFVPTSSAPALPAPGASHGTVAAPASRRCRPRRAGQKWSPEPVHRLWVPMVRDETPAQRKTAHGRASGRPTGGPHERAQHATRGRRRSSMYATCLFCSGDLGRNESIEALPSCTTWSGSTMPPGRAAKRTGSSPRRPGPCPHAEAADVGQRPVGLAAPADHIGRLQRTCGAAPGAVGRRPTPSRNAPADRGGGAGIRPCRAHRDDRRRPPPRRPRAPPLAHALRRDGGARTLCAVRHLRRPRPHGDRHPAPGARR